jgi:hypothetical protein
LSATNRGGERIDQDAYFTPHWATYGIAPFLFGGEGGARFRTLPIVDPACGNGQILTPLRRLGLDPAQLYGFELNRAFAYDAAFSTGARVHACDTLATYADWRPSCAVSIVMNPPYSLAFNFVQWAVKVAASCGGQVAALLRVNFLASAEREDFFAQFPPFVGVSSRRPCFVRFKRRNKSGKIVTSSGDATEYAWIGWRFDPFNVDYAQRLQGGGHAHRIDPSSAGRLFWIPTRDAATRAALAAEGFTPPDDVRGPPAPIVDETATT